MVTAATDDPDALPPGAKWDDEVSASPYDADPNALPAGAKWDDDDSAATVNAPTKKPYEITDPAEAGAAARAYDPRGGETGFHPLHALGTLGSIAAQSASGAGQSLINIGSKVVGADPATVTRKLGLGSPNDLLTPDAAALEKGIADSPIGQAIRHGAQYVDSALGKISPIAQNIAHEAAGDIQDIGNVAGVTSLAAGPVSRVISGAGDLAKAGIAREAATLNVPSEPVPPPVRPASDAQAVLAQHAANSPQSMGAAAAAPSLEGTSPELQHVIANSTNPNMEAVERHRNADTLPMPEGKRPAPLTKGQATRDDQAISDEYNLRTDPDTHGLLTARLTDQGNTMNASMGEIRRRATPEIVQRADVDHDQVAIDAIKKQINAQTVLTRAKYKALADENGGVMPINKGAAATNVDAELRHEALDKLVAEHNVMGPIVERLHSDEPMTFADWRNATQRLSEIQRGGSSEGVAASIIRNQFENMPLSDGAQHLRGMLNDAKSEAKKGFDTIEQNPAFAAVADDNVPKDKEGLHVIGAPSPLAGKFLERYATGDGPNASRAYVSRLQSVMKDDPDFAPAVEASALNRLRSAAKLDEFDSGNFASKSFNNAFTAMRQKAPVLMKPETIDNLGRLQQYSDDVTYEGKGASKNRSGSASTLIRYGAQFPEDMAPVSQGRAAAGTLAEVGTDMLAASHGAVPFIAKRLGQNAWRIKKEKQALALRAAQEQSVKNAKLRWAQDATAPGAGIDTPAPTPPVTGRASGGRVDHEALVNRLFTRWKQAQKESDRVTEPLLSLPDEAITKALRIASQSQARI